MEKNERETIIRWDEADGILTVYSSSSRDMKRIETRLKEYPDDVQLVRRDEYGITVRMPAEWRQDIPKPRRTRILTDEQKADAAERMRKAREARSADSGEK